MIDLKKEKVKRQKKNNGNLIANLLHVYTDLR